MIKRYKNLKLIIADSLLQTIYQSSHPHYPKEFGGFLFGKYSDDFKTLYIEKFMVTELFTNSSIEFVRESAYLASDFKKLFINEGIYYIGEWHTHPNGKAWYSSTDLNAMINIRKDHGVQIENPILLILSITKDSLRDYNFFVLNNNRLEVYE